LREIVHFDPLATPSGSNPFGRNRVETVALAVEALGAIEGDRALDDMARSIRCGLSKLAAVRQSFGRIPLGIRERWSRKKTNRGDQADDPMAAIRYHAVSGLKHCRSDRARELLREATNDPHPEVAAFAREVLATREADT
jgi:hypothetical protein